MAAELPQSLEQLVHAFSRLPGIGRRTAQRLAFHLLRADQRESIDLARALDTMRERIVRCERCHGYSEAPICTLCSDTRRDESLLCVVEEPTDVILIERTHEFRGRYHVLGGALSPLDDVGPDDIELASLFRRIAQGEVRELVIATSPTMTGEATASFIADRLRDQPVKLTRLASGLPVGVDLEHTDEATLSQAFAERRSLT